ETWQWRWSSESAQRLLSRAGRTLTDRDGSFHLTNLNAGRYYVSAGGQISAPETGRQIRGRPGSTYPLTYHPGALDVSGARAIQLGPGEEARGNDVRLKRTTLARLRGSVVNTYSFQPVGILSLDLVSLSDAAAIRQIATVD